jgi:Uma2 family endonuclease
MHNYMTARELESVDIPGKVTELVQGRLVVKEPPGTEHGRMAANLAFLISAFVRPRKLGAVYSQDTGFKIAANPDTVRAPDVAFVSVERRPEPGRGYASVAPDLVVEIRSPDDPKAEVAEKMQGWLAAGTRLAWVIEMDRRVASAHRPDGTTTVVEPDGFLDGETVLPGFRCRLAEVFE